MCIQAQHKLSQNILGVIMMIAAFLLAESTQALAVGSASPLIPSNIGYKYKQYQTHYDVNADGSYSESVDLVITVLTARTVEMSRRMPVGMRSVTTDPGNADSSILTAYTLKKSGEHIAAAPASPSAGLGSVASDVLPMLMPFSPTIFITFQGVEIGDALVVSYKTIQKKAAIPNNIVINQLFPKFLVYEDATVSLSAPKSLSLRIETIGVEKGENAIDGQTQKWVWKYQNIVPVAQPPSIDRIHISTFKDNNAEFEAMKKLAMAYRAGRGCQVLPGNLSDGPAAMQFFQREVANFFSGAEDYLDQEVKDWNSPACVFDDGRPRLTALKGGFSLAFSDEKDWNKSFARLEYLKKRFPNTAFVALAEARYWIDYAWDARGSGYASSVSEEGWKLFHERLRKAERVLIETKPYSSTLPSWYEEMIVVQSALDRPEDERDKTFIEGATKYKTFYPIYFAMLNHLTPKWGGSWETVDNMVKWSIENTKAIDGNSMYARLYWTTDQGMEAGANPFKTSHASWEKIKQGFEDLMARHPKSKWNLNNFARFACQAEDKETFLKLRRQIGKDVIDEAWSYNISLELCETKFGYEQ